MLIIYKKTTGEIVENQGTNSMFPNGVEDVTNIVSTIIKRLGGTENEYEVLRLHDEYDKVIVEKTFTHEYSVLNNQIVFGGLRPVPEFVPQPPTEIEILKQENEMLQASVMELSAYAASQDERLQTQENAVMELSMLVAGGGA